MGKFHRLQLSFSALRRPLVLASDALVGVISPCIDKLLGHWCSLLDLAVFSVQEGITFDN